MPPSPNIDKQIYVHHNYNKNQIKQAALENTNYKIIPNPTIGGDFGLIHYDIILDRILVWNGYTWKLSQFLDDGDRIDNSAILFDTVWTDVSTIPNTLISASGSAIVTNIVGLTLSYATGSYTFNSPTLIDVVPVKYGSFYTPVLLTATGTPIPVGYLNYKIENSNVTFYDGFTYSSSVIVNELNPPLISFWKYTGAKGGSIPSSTVVGLDHVLMNYNNSGTSSIIMGTSTFISSQNNLLLLKTTGSIFELNDNAFGGVATQLITTNLIENLSTGNIFAATYSILTSQSINLNGSTGINLQGQINIESNILNLNNNRITNVATGSSVLDAVNVSQLHAYVATASPAPSLPSVLSIGNSSGTFSIDMNGNTIINVATGSNPLDAINLSQLETYVATASISGTGSNNVITQWTGTMSIGNGAWAFNGDTLYPLNDKVNIGIPGTNRIATIYLASVLDYSGDLNFRSNGIIYGKIKTDGKAGFGINISPSASLHVIGTSSVSSDYTLKVDDGISNTLLYVRNDGAVSSLNGYWQNDNLILSADVSNTRIGYLAGLSNFGDNNIFIGKSFVSGANSGNYNISIGQNFITYPNSGNNCVFIGYNIDYVNSFNNSVILNSSIQLTSDYQILIGDGGHSVGFGTNPTSKIHIQGFGFDLSTYSLKINNSIATPTLYVRDDGFVSLSTATQIGSELLNVNGSVYIANAVNIGSYATITSPSALNPFNFQYNTFALSNDQQIFLVHDEFGDVRLRLFESSSLILGPGPTTDAFGNQSQFSTPGGNFTFYFEYALLNQNGNTAQWGNSNSGDVTFGSTILGDISHTGNLILTTDNNSTAIFAQGGNQFIGISTDTPSAKVHIIGSGDTDLSYSLKIVNSLLAPLLYVRDDGMISMGSSMSTASLLYVDGNQASGYVLTSDAFGNATWQANSGGGSISGSTNSIPFFNTSSSLSSSPITYNGTDVNFDAITGNIIFGVSNTEFARINNNGAWGIGTTANTAALTIHGAAGYDQLCLQTSYTPSGTADINGHQGDIAWDDNFIYIKTSAGWKRSTLTTF
jgi:hypothetical protein